MWWAYLNKTVRKNKETSNLTNIWKWLLFLFLLLSYCVRVSAQQLHKSCSTLNSLRKTRHIIFIKLGCYSTLLYPLTQVPVPDFDLFVSAGRVCCSVTFWKFNGQEDILALAAQIVTNRERSGVVGLNKRKINEREHFYFYFLLLVFLGFFFPHFFLSHLISHSRGFFCSADISVIRLLVIKPTVWKTDADLDKRLIRGSLSQKNLLEQV